MCATKLEDNREIQIYQSKDGALDIDVRLEKETVWLSQKQMAGLFNKDSDTVGKHIQNIYKEGELEEAPTTAKYSVVQKEGNREVSRDISFYNLDVVISVGYRVKSKEGTQFRIWATKVLRDHVLKGYSLNKKRLQDKGMKEFEKTLTLFKQTLKHKKLDSDEATSLLQIITDYADSWLLLQQFDEDKVQKVNEPKKAKYALDYGEAKEAVSKLKEELEKDSTKIPLFGNEREKMLEAVLASICQTFGGEDLYPNIEEKASHLFYFLIKDHPFSDGNKRIGSLLFILFLDRNNYLYNREGERKFNNSALVALALLIAASDPQQKDTMIKLIMNFISSS